MRFVKWGVGAVVLLLVIGYAIFNWYAGAVQPVVEGEIAVSGPRAPVQIVRDREGIPHIYAASPEDAWFGQGWAHAQDRLWQMEFSRRALSGRLSEVLGEPTLGIDRFLRTLGIRRSAEAIAAGLAPDQLKPLEAYAAGVNAYLASRTGPLPPEFLILGAPDPEPWTPVDSIGWTLMMAFDLGENWRDEILRLRLVQAGWDRARIDEFMPNYLSEPYPVQPDYGALYDGVLAPPPGRVAASPVPLADQSGIGSNNWVLSGRRTASGKPLLANDPHLGLNTPALWYFAHLSAPGLDVVGASLPGVPGIILGRNQRIAWGFTNTGPDVQDLFVERLDPADPSRYLVPGGESLPFDRVVERIRVKDQPDVTLEVRFTRHGPVLSPDAFPPVADLLAPGHVLAFSWSALSPENHTVAAIDELNRATGWTDFQDALRLFHSPQQNIVYADVEGTIGLLSPGRIPVRRPGNDLMGLAPAPGWTGDYDWVDWVPFGHLPRAFNPEGGSISTANARVGSPDNEPFLRYDFDLPLRKDRIDDLLSRTELHDVASTRAIQADAHSNSLERLMPILLLTQGANDEEKALLDKLRAFDLVMAVDRPEPLIASAWMRELTRLVYADDLGALFGDYWDHRTEFMTNVLTDRDGMGARWCDDGTTPDPETCQDLIARAFSLAVDDLKARYGSDPDGWTWGEAHPSKALHRPFGNVSLLAGFFDVTVPTAGDRHSLNVGWFDVGDVERPFANTHAASLRAIYDLSGPDTSVFIHSTGQSGIVFSPYYRNFAERWAAVDYVPMLMSRGAVEDAAVATLTLMP